MTTNTQILDTLRKIDDPEMPINIVDLGLVVDIRVCDGDDDGASSDPAIEIDLTPTFIGCPALDVIRDDVRSRVAADCDVPAERVTVNYLFTPRWSVERISDAGRERLKTFGVTVPERGCVAQANADASDLEQIIASSTADATVPLTIGGAPATVPCPFCESTKTTMESPFGPTRCRMIYYCPACKNSFEHLKTI